MTMAPNTQHLQQIVRSESHRLSPIPTEREDLLIPMPDVRVAAFDVYGTLLTSAAGEIAVAENGRGSLERFCSHFGLSQRRDAAQIRTELRAAIDESHRSARARGVDVPEVDIVQIWRTVMDRLPFPDGAEVEEVALRYELATNPVWPMPGAKETVDHLRNMGITLAIVSNAQFYTPLVIEALFDCTLLELGFRTCLWSYREGRAKPSSLLFARLLSDVGNVDPSRVVYIGNDMLNDVEGAAAAGYRTVLFAGDRRSLRERRDDGRVKAKPDAVITSLSQLTGILRKDTE